MRFSWCYKHTVISFINAWTHHLRASFLSELYLPKERRKNLKNVSWKSTKWWKLLVDISDFHWYTNINAMPFVHTIQIDDKQNDKSYFLHHGHSKSHCFITDDGIKFYHDCLWFEDVVYLYAFSSARIYFGLVKLCSVIFDFSNKVNVK